MELKKLLITVGISTFFSLTIFFLLIYPGVHFLVIAGGELYNNPKVRTFALSFSNNPYLFLKLADFDLPRGRSDYYLEDLNMGLALCGPIYNTNPVCIQLYSRLDNLNSGLK